MRNHDPGNILDLRLRLRGHSSRQILKYHTRRNFRTSGVQRSGREAASDLIYQPRRKSDLGWAAARIRSVKQCALDCAD